MDTVIYNIDSRHRNTTNYTNPYNFRYKLPDGIKNVVEIELSSCEFEDYSTCTHLVSYGLIKINDYGNVNNVVKDSSDQTKLYTDTYFAKVILPSVTVDPTPFISTTYKFKQPVDIRNLDIKLYDYQGNYLTGIEDFSITLNFKTVNNQLLKQYHELAFYSQEAMQMLLHDKMLQFYSSQLEQKSSVFLNNPVANNMMTNMSYDNKREQEKYHGIQHNYMQQNNEQFRNISDQLNNNGRRGNRF